MILTHGWSGSIVELLKVIDPLTRLVQSNTCSQNPYFIHMSRISKLLWSNIAQKKASRF